MEGITSVGSVGGGGCGGDEEGGEFYVLLEQQEDKGAEDALSVAERQNRQLRSHHTMYDILELRATSALHALKPSHFR